MTSDAKPSLAICLAASLLIACAIQIAAVAALQPVSPYDGKEYLSISGSLYHGRGYAIIDASFDGFPSFNGEAPTRMRQPGYPLYLFLVYWLLGQRILVVQISQVILNSLTLYLVFLIARRAFGDKLWPGTLIAVGLYFPLWTTSAFVLTESLFAFLLALFMLALQDALYKRSTRYFALIGLILGAAFLVRPIALIVCPFCLIPIWLATGFRRAARLWILLCLGFLAASTPWTVRNGIAFGEFTPLSTDGGYNLWYASQPERTSGWFGSPEFRAAVDDGYYTDRRANERFTRLAVAHVKSDPASYVRRGLFRAAWVWSYLPGSQLFRERRVLFVLLSLAQLAILAFATVGLVRTKSLWAACFLLPAASFTVGLLFTLGISRFLVPAMPYVVVLAGQGFRSVFPARNRVRIQERHEARSAA